MHGVHFIVNPPCWHCEHFKYSEHWFFTYIVNMFDYCKHLLEPQRMEDLPPQVAYDSDAETALASDSDAESLVSDDGAVETNEAVAVAANEAPAVAVCAASEPDSDDDEEAEEDEDGDDEEAELLPADPVPGAEPQPGQAAEPPRKRRRTWIVRQAQSVAVAGPIVPVAAAVHPNHWRRGADAAVVARRRTLGSPLIFS